LRCVSPPPPSRPHCKPKTRSQYAPASTRNTQQKEERPGQGSHRDLDADVSGAHCAQGVCGRAALVRTAGSLTMARRQGRAAEAESARPAAKSAQPAAEAPASEADSPAVERSTKNATRAWLAVKLEGHEHALGVVRSEAEAVAALGGVVRLRLGQRGRGARKVAAACTGARTQLAWVSGRCAGAARPAERGPLRGATSSVNAHR
jgi:hypothetical protein